MKEFFHEIPDKIATITEVTHHCSWYCSHESFGDLGPRSLQCKKYIVHTQPACSYAEKSYTSIILTLLKMLHKVKCLITNTEYLLSPLFSFDRVIFASEFYLWS